MKQYLKAMSVGVIGGADGPTAIFVTTSPVSGWVLVVVLIAIALLVAWRLYRNKKK